MFLRTLSLILCAIAAHAITLEDASQKLDTLWKAQSRGDAPAYHAFLSKDVKIITNGEEDVAPWKDVGFVKDLFSKLIFSDVELAVPIVAIPDQPNSFLANSNWAVTVQSTGETIQMGLWSQKITFDEQSLIKEIDSIADGNVLEQFGNALNIVAYGDAVKQNVVAFIDSMNKKDVNACFEKFGLQFEFTRNGFSDFRYVATKNLQYFFEKVPLNIELTDFVLSSTSSVNMRVKNTATIDGKTVTWPEAWIVTFDADLKLIAIAVVGDSVEYSHVDKALGAQ